jgi:hypothetical protein
LDIFNSTINVQCQNQNAKSNLNALIPNTIRHIWALGLEHSFGIRAWTFDIIKACNILANYFHHMFTPTNSCIGNHTLYDEFLLDHSRLRKIKQNA